MATNVLDIRNLAVCGHGSSGKTTLVDQLLVRTGAVQGNPNVDTGQSICDFDEEEKLHHHSVEATLTHFDHAGKHFNMIDTPGYPDLIGQTIGALRGVDTALITVDGHAGIKVNTRRAWKEAGDAGIGRIICITRLDDASVDLSSLVEAIQAQLGQSCVLFNAPNAVGPQFERVVSTLTLPEDGETSGDAIEICGLGLKQLHQQAIELIIEHDDEAMERYFEGQLPRPQELAELAVQGIRDQMITPIVCCSAKTGVGLQELLDLLAKEALPPCEKPTFANGACEELPPLSKEGPLVAQVFKTRIDPFVQKLSFIRVYSGTLRQDSTVPVPGSASDSKKGIKIGQLLSVQADKTEPVEEAGPGEIVAVAKCDELHTGVCLGEIDLPPIDFPTAMIGLAVSPKSHGDEAKLSTALHKLVEEDPTVHVEHDPETHETVLTGMSELHLNLVRERLARRDHVEIETHEPKIPYRETLQLEASGNYRHKKQSGGSGQFAEIHIRMFPFPEGIDPDEFANKDRFPHHKHHHYHAKHHFLWVDSVVGGSIPGNFMPAIEKGFLERIQQGVIAGCPVQNVCVEVHFGKDHPVDSNETAFRMAANHVFSEVFASAKPVLMEPLVTLHITAPTDSVGDISSDLPGRRGQMLGMDQAPGGMTSIMAKAPLAEVTTYSRTLSSLTGGQGSYTLEFSHYEPAPGHVQQAIIAAAKEGIPA